MRKIQSNSTLLTVRGGPWAGELVRVPNQGTVKFRVKGWVGRYNGNGEWIDG